MARAIKPTLIGALAACALAATAGAAPARAAEPWWHMTVGSRPSTIGGGHNEVQQLTVSGAEGGFFIEDTEKGESGEFAFFTWDATHQELQEGLEGLYGAGNVEVPKGQGNEAGSEPYEVIFTGALAYRRVEPMVAFASFFGIGLIGGREEAAVTELTAGRPDGKIVLLATNLGDAAADASTKPITITDDLPAGLEPLSISGKVANPSVTRAPVQCELATMSCTFDGSLPPYEMIEVEVGVNARNDAKSEEADAATVEGGGAGAASGSLTLRLGGEPTFGVQSYELTAETEGGGAVTQAGAHPFQLTTTLMLDQTGEAKPVALAKDLEFKLPPGLVGNPTAYPQCSLREFLKLVQSPLSNGCRPETALGVVNAVIQLSGQVESRPSPLFNLEPEAGEPARFGFWAEGLVPVVLDTSVRTGGDYGITVSVHDISQDAEFLGSQVTFWGVPGNPIHDEQRGWGCLYASDEGREGYACKPEEERNPAPFLSMPSSCNGSMQAPVLADSWRRPGAFGEFGLNSPLSVLDGCSQERFEPSIKASPDYEEASRPSGLSVDVHVPQELQTNATATAESEVKQIKVELPKGVTVNPGGAGGLQACSLDEMGFKGFNPSIGRFEFTPAYPSCPKQSKVATVTVHTPLLPHAIEGAVYLATPAPFGELNANPFNSLITMYLVAEDPISGFLLKLPMRVALNEATGQVVSYVEEVPELPFEDAELHFFGGGRAPLATPGLCGSYTTKAVFTPWSSNEPVTSTSTFNITSGPNGSPCPSNPKPFTPEFNAGTTNNQAGGYSELRTNMGHPDVDQALGALKMTLPPGMMGSLAHVKLCPEPQANEGTCGPESLIGHTTVTAGLGSTPAVVARPGNVYITTGYKGAPYGLSIANPAETGPFDLEKGTKCDCIVVRAKVEVNPHTAQLTITSDPLPSMLEGIPLDLQHVSVQINRPDFTFNPTNCDPLKIEGTMSGAEGAVSPISEPFQVANCANLAFKPTFSASTSAKTSKRYGASLHVSVTYPKEATAKDANLKYVKVELPKALPSQLETLKHACLEAVFNANPASCPIASVVGHAIVHTPVLPVPLQGPAYFVSHGGREFPSLTIVLQGYGVTVELVGETYISKGVTSSTFSSTPDVPFESFELTLPQGTSAALAANGNLCNQKLVMPTHLTGQNGATLEQQTRIAVQGCAGGLKVLSKRIKGRTLALRVVAPSAGTLKASGKGLSSASESAGGREPLSLVVHVSARAGSHSKVKLAFKPVQGKRLSKTVPFSLKRG